MKLIYPLIVVLVILLGMAVHMTAFNEGQEIGDEGAHYTQEVCDLVCPTGYDCIVRQGNCLINEVPHL